MSPSSGASSSTIWAPHSPFTNAVLATTPARMPYGCDVISPYPLANWIGEWMTVAPCARAASTTSLVWAIMSVDSMTSATAPCSAPPSDVKSFWNSTRTTAVLFGSMAVLLSVRMLLAAQRSPAP